MSNLTVQCFNQTFKNPLMPGSGTYSYGLEFAKFYNVNILGALVMKTITKLPRIGNKQPRVSSVSNGMLNSIGLENPGIDVFCRVLLPNIKKLYPDLPLIVSIYGFSTDEYLNCLDKVLTANCTNIIELNLSCPNVHQPDLAIDIPDLIRQAKQRPNNIIIVKLALEMPNLNQLAIDCQAAGADAITLINSIKAMRINLNTRKPYFDHQIGGLSGPCIKPIAVRLVYEISQIVTIPIIASGGIETAYDVLEYLLAGAQLVQVGASNFKDPYIMQKIINDLPSVLAKFNFNSVSEVIQWVKKNRE